MSRLVACVSHTPWIPERRESMAQLRGQLGVSESVNGIVVDGQPRTVYFEMTDRAHVSVWSERQWTRALELSKGEGHCLFLQDDDKVVAWGGKRGGYPFWSALRAILEVVPDQLVGLHLHHPGAIAASAAGERFVTTMSCVGIGYVFPAPLLRDFLAWRHALGPDRIYRTSEDVLIDAWCIFRRRRVWHPVPTIVRSDAAQGSTGGGGGRFVVDDQYHRKTVLGWEGFRVQDLVDPAWWRAGLRAPPRHLVFAGIARPGVSRTQLPAEFDGHHRASRGRMAG